MVQLTPIRAPISTLFSSILAQAEGLVPTTDPSPRHTIHYTRAPTQPQSTTGAPSVLDAVCARRRITGTTVTPQALDTRLTCIAQPYLPVSAPASGSTNAITTVGGDVYVVMLTL